MREHSTKLSGLTGNCMQGTQSCVMSLDKILAKILGLHFTGNGEPFEGLIQGTTHSILYFTRLTLATM